MITRILLPLIFLCGTLVGDDKEKLKIEKLVYSKSDDALNEIYQKARKSLPEKEFSDLVLEQRKWIQYRDYRAENAARTDGGAKEGREKENSEYWATAAAITDTRTAIIRGLLDYEKISSKTWEGIWTDGKGGILQILEKKDGSFRFLIQVVRGPTYHNGQISGTAKTNENHARFAVTGDGADRETWLNFFRDQKRLKITGINTQYFHGARAYFDGVYVRTSAIDEKEFEAELKELSAP